VPDLAYEIGTLLREKGLTLGTVESATGGLISHLITNIPGSSDYFKGSIVSYSNEVKIKVAGVRKESIDKEGAVSARVAEEMAAGGKRLLEVDICISDTGIAGPSGGTTDKPVGLFYLGLSSSSVTTSRRHIFQGSREENKWSAAQAALKFLYEYLIKLSE